MPNEKKFTIGEIAKLTGVTIRTLQYYDNIKLVPLERDASSGKRYYSESDLTRLQQVLFYKSLGLKIEDIKKLVADPVTPEQIGHVLNRQLELSYRKLNDVKNNIALLEASLISLQESNRIPLGNLIQLMVSLNKDTLFEYQHVQYDPDTENIFMEHYQDGETVLAVYWDWKSLVLEAVTLIMNKIEPESDQGRKFAEKWIRMIARVTKGNPELLEAHKTSYANREQWPEEDRRLMEFANNFIDQATKTYLANKNDQDGERGHD